MSPEEILSRAEAARRVLEDPMVSNALNDMEKEVIHQWEACPARDTEGRETLWMLYKQTKRFRMVFEGHIQSGVLAKEQLREKQSLAEKVKKRFR